jgi:hypothetical protein
LAKWTEAAIKFNSMRTFNSIQRFNSIRQLYAPVTQGDGPHQPPFRIDLNSRIVLYRKIELSRGPKHYIYIYMFITFW